MPEVLFRHLKAHEFIQQGCVFFTQYSLATSITNRAQIFTGLLFNADVGIHQVRILVFDNYKRCPGVDFTIKRPPDRRSCRDPE